VCRVLISGGAKVEHRVPEPKTSIYVQCSFCLKMAAHKVYHLPTIFILFIWHSQYSVYRASIRKRWL
jgi:hypothetical protein